MRLGDLSTPDWHVDAACVGKWDLFDSPEGDRQINACKTICFQLCPVRSQCLHDAMKTEPVGELRHTIRGGYMPTERTTILGIRTPKEWNYQDTLQF